MHIAFIITKTPQEEGFNNFTKFLNLYPEDQNFYIYLIGNGVYCATHGHVHAELIHTLSQHHQVMASKDDLLARGLDSKHIITNVETFNDYGDLVTDIMEKMDQVMSF